MSDSSAHTREGEALAALKRKEYQKAYRLYKSLAQTGSASAMLTIGRLYLNGIGVTKNHAEARHWFERAYASNREAIRNYAALILQEIYWYGRGVPINYDKAFGYVKAFEHIEHPALSHAMFVYSVAIHYERGRGVPKDIPRAMELYRRAADAGHIMSRIMLDRRKILQGDLLALPSWIVAVLKLQLLELIKGRNSADLRLWR